MVNFLFGRMFFWDLLLIGFVATAHFPKRGNFAVRAAIAAVGCTLLSCGWSAVFSGGTGQGIWGMLRMMANYFGAFVIVMAALCFCVELRGWTSMYIGATVWFVQHAANCLDFALKPQGRQDLPSYAGHVCLVALAAALAYVCFLRKLDIRILGRMRLQTVAPVWLMMCLVCLILNSYASLVGENSTSFYLADLAFNVIGLFYQNSLYQFAGLQRENESVQMLLRQSRKQYQIAKENMEQVNIKCHDLRHQIHHFRREGRIDETVLNEMEHTVSAYDTTIKTGNAALDVILTEKSLLCNSKGIGFTCMAEGAGLGYIEPADLYALFGNALENAIEATEQLSQEEKKQIVMTVRKIGGFYSVHVQNYTRDMLQFENDLPLTSKEDKLNHGFGVRSMQLLVEKYGGELSFEQEEDVVNLYLLLPCRMPADDNL